MTTWPTTSTVRERKPRRALLAVLSQDVVRPVSALLAGSAVLTLAGLACLVAAAWVVGVAWGLAATGVALLVFDRYRE